MPEFLRPEVYGPGWTIMTFDRKQLVPLLKELVGRQPVSAEDAEALKWLRDNVHIFAGNYYGWGWGELAPQCRRYLVALRRAAAGTTLNFYDRQLLEQVAECVHGQFGETLFEGVASD
jgi:hypothetical protein